MNVRRRSLYLEVELCLFFRNRYACFHDLAHLDKYRDAGLLLLRVTVGCLLAFLHGWGKIVGGPEQWAGLGGVMGKIFGLGFLPTVWGLAHVGSKV